MKKYTQPKMEVKKFNRESILTTSAASVSNGESSQSLTESVSFGSLKLGI